jgi:integrase
LAKEVFVSLGNRVGVGYPVKPDALHTILQRRCDDAGVPRRKFHALRHSSVLDALDAGIDAAKVQAQLGHASITTIMKYARGQDEDRAWAYRDRSLSAGLSKRAERRRRRGPGGEAR